ncbi:MAG: hypothetical protein AAFQ85_11200, partial [Pseudomonadota bacterium]
MNRWRIEPILRAGLIGMLAIAVATPILVLSLYAFSGQWNYPALVPQAYTLKWFDHAIRYENALGALGFSVVLACLTTILTALVGIPAGYALSRYRFRGRVLVELMFLAKTSVPVILLGVGLATVFFATGLHDTLLGLLQTRSRAYRARPPSCAPA